MDMVNSTLFKLYICCRKLWKMGLYKQFFRFGRRRSNYMASTAFTPLPMLVSDQGKIRTNRLIIVVVGLFALAIGILLSSVPWLDYLILKHLRLSNGSLSYYYWQKPGVVRLTKVYIFNVTNPENFLNLGEKPKLNEIGPFVYRENMEKVNIKFHDNGTVSYQHKKILQFVPELSVNKNEKLTVPNIPMLTLASLSNSLGFIIQKAISFALTMGNYQPFVEVTADELVFGYEDPLVTLAHNFYPKTKRPMGKMGLLIKRNGTLDEVHTINTGYTGMEKFGLLDKLNGIDRLPYWEDPPCTDIVASEGSFFPPRDVTQSDIVALYDKDLCRILPFQYRGPTSKQGISVDLYTPPDYVFETASKESRNRCYCPGAEYCPPKGLQNISPCQYDAPVYLSFPHFYNADASLLKSIDGLEPIKEKHENYVKIQPKLGVPLEIKLRVQLNLRVDQAENVRPVSTFPSMMFPIMWLEEGIDEVTPAIRRWVYLATTFSDLACPIFTYGSIVTGSCILIGVFINTYKSLVFTKQSIEIGMKTLRRNGAYLSNHSLFSQQPHRLSLIVRNSYVLLDDGDGATPDREKAC
ncbi:scavenger receptor class B member 1-like isoform X1 [Photinus pyralis]|uniref:scavenger receptor class B member 1-like isoform X1 n=1 Tax=Photinus pyralis TaxID=7054 RepID=UPI001266F5B7|nr:scavenger receptor class B member 1-like isoform X1 [Photinus pyralis]XP_031330517.1 scavenger receptor class B member 1-like isoform X1 [Photinus pyralis]